MTPSDAVIWHDLECGRYRQDLTVWAQLADESGDPILDVGAGTGRVSLELARRGHRVVAMDLEAELLAALRERADALSAGARVGAPGPGVGAATGMGAGVTTVQADARAFDLGDERFALCVVPMQTIQLLGGGVNRRAFLARAKAHLSVGGVLAIAIAPEFEEFVWAEGTAMPLPDMVELDGTIYASQPTAVLIEGDQAILQRRREVIDPRGGREVSEDRIALDLLGAATLIADGVAMGLRPVGTRTIAETDEHVGSLVVIFGA
jgi:SAM-dependent methyltransferase